MPKGVATLVIIVLLAVSGMLGVSPSMKLAMANPSMIPPMPETPDLNEPKIIFKLPEENKTYNINAVPYSIFVEKPSSWFDYNPVHGMIMTIEYILDGDLRIEIADQPAYYETGPSAYEGMLPGLFEGNHTLEVYVRSDSFYDPPDKPRPQVWPWGKMPPQDYYLDTYSGKVYFAVDTTPPAVSILFPNDTTYSSAEVPLNFAVDEPTSLMTYCVDNMDNATALGNFTLSGLSNGQHTLAIYAWDIAGNVGVSETFTFQINRQPESTSKSETFPISPVATGCAAVAALVGSAAVVVYLKKRKPSGVGVVKNP